MKRWWIILILCVGLALMAGCDEDNGGGGGGGVNPKPIDPPVTPLPGALLLVGIGTACVGWFRRK